MRRRSNDRKPRTSRIARESGAVSMAVLLIVVILAIAVVGGGLFIALGRKSAEAAPKPVAGKTVQAGEYLTNLADPGGRKYIKVVLEVEVSDARAVQELQKKNGTLRNAILSVLRGKTSDDLAGPEGMVRLADDLGSAIGGVLTSGRVLGVHFLDFLIQ